jgi:hypothetical protein
MDQVEMESRLWEYIDGLTDPAGRTAIENLIAENQEWKSKYAELLDLHQSINLVDLEQPSMRFSRNVMEEISRLQITPAAKNYINQKIIWSIGWFFILMIVGILIYGIGQINWSDANDPSSSFGLDLNKLDYSRIFNNNFVNIFMGLNLVLGLMLLDRYLSKRMKGLLKSE